MKKRYLLSFIFFFGLLLSLNGCSEEGNILKDPKFEKWKGGELSEWKLEGEGTLIKTETGAELISKGDSTPFIYQQISVKRRYKGMLLTLAAWVKTKSPESVYIELSDRQGHDSKSDAHSGDGEWHLLKLTARVPETSETIELRVRNFKPSDTFVKEASISTGTVASIDRENIPRVSVSGAYKIAGIFASTVLMVLTFVFFKARKDIKVKVIEAFILLVILSNIMLMAGKPINSAITANIAWGLLALAFIVYIISRVHFKPSFSFLKRPGAFCVAVSVISLILTLNAIRGGSVSKAEKAAKAAYLSMLAGAVSISARKVYRVFSKDREEMVRVYRNGAAWQSADMDGR